MALFPSIRRQKNAPEFKDGDAFRASQDVPRQQFHERGVKAAPQSDMVLVQGIA